MLFDNSLEHNGKNNLRYDVRIWYPFDIYRTYRDNFSMNQYQAKLKSFNLKIKYFENKLKHSNEKERKIIRRKIVRLNKKISKIKIDNAEDIILGEF